MKRLTYLLISMSILLPRAYAQDVITTTSSETILARIIETTGDSILYKRFYQQEGVTRSIAKNEIASIRYEQDSSLIASHHVPSKLDSFPKGYDFYESGKEDARKYYKGSNAAIRGTVFATMLLPLGGLIPAIGTSTTPPKEVNLNYPDSVLMKQKDYRYGYTKKARQIKSSKVWKGYGFAAAANIVALFVFGIIKV